MPPANHHHSLKRSRLIWENATRPHDTKLEAIKAYLSAILYELQPIRLSTLRQVWARWTTTTTNQRQAVTTLVTEQVPNAARAVYQFLFSLTPRQWMWMGLVIVYYYFVKWMHTTLDVGPVVLISTALVLIFTIGLGDDEDKEPGEHVSAYSVFNRGFRRLLGEADEQQLLHQHMGGGGGLGMMMMQGAAAAEQNVEDEEEENVGRRRRHDDDGGAAARGRLREEVAGAGAPQNNHDGDGGGGEPDEQPPQNRARRTGKKARRRDLEQRREMRRQREAAVAMGFEGGEGGANEAVAMQQLLEQQIQEAENNLNHQNGALPQE